MNVSNQYISFLFIGALALSTLACAEQYDPAKSSDAASAVNVDRTAQPLYRSFKIYNETSGTPPQSGTAVDYLLTLDKNEAPVGFTSMGAYLSVLTNASPTRNQIFRCTTYSIGANLIHYISIDSTCEGGTVEGSLGYLEQSPIGNVVIPVHRCSGSAYNLPGGISPFLQPIHNIITVDQTDCMTNSTTPSILGYSI